jgi:hypothetical protein
VEAARLHTPWVRAEEDDLPILICRGIHRPLAELWPGKKRYR